MVATALLLALGASMLSGLRHVLRREKRRTAAPERERVHRALAPIAMKLDADLWGSSFGQLPAGFDRDAFRRSLPALEPPLSQTIIEDRDEGRERRA